MAKAAKTFVSIHIMGLTFLYLLVEPLSFNEMLVAGALLAVSFWGLVTGLRNPEPSFDNRGRTDSKVPMPT